LDTYLTPRQVADRYQISVETLKDWRYHGDGPKYVKLGQQVRYRLRDLEEWERTREAGDD
jgi:predicted DNA-binding transcriptional regulator AlpA